MTHSADSNDAVDHNTETFDVIYADHTAAHTAQSPCTDSTDTASGTETGTTTGSTTRSITPVNSDDAAPQCAIPPNTHITIHAQNLSALSSAGPVAQLHSDSLVVSMLPMPNNSDIWTHTLSSPLKPLTLHTYKTIKQNPTKQCRLQLRINKALNTQYTARYSSNARNVQHNNNKRKLAADGCHYVTDDSSSDSSDDEQNELLNTVKNTYQYQHKRQMIQRSIYNNIASTMDTLKREYTLDEQDNVSDSDDTDSDEDAAEHGVLPVTHDGLTTSDNSETSETSETESVDEESLIPSDLLDIPVEVSA